MRKPLQAKATANDHQAAAPLRQPRATDSALLTSTIAALNSVCGRLNDDAASHTVRQVVGLLQELHVSNQTNLNRYRVLINAVPDAVTLHDEHGRILDANQAACLLYGYPLEDLKRKRIVDLNPDLAHDHMETVWQTLGLGQTVTVETSNRNASGDLFPVEVHSNAFLDQGERRIVAVARDTTARQRGERELRASEKRYRMLLQAMDKGVMVHGPDAGVVSVNPAACRLFGMTEAELLNIGPEQAKTWHFVDENNRTFGFDEVPARRVLRTGKAVDSTIIGVFLPHLHDYRWFSAAAIPQYDESSGALLQIVTTFSDVSTLKRETSMFRTTQLLADIGCWELDDLRGTLFWTEQMYRIHDLPINSAMNETRALSFFMPAARAEFANALSNVRSHGTRFKIEVQLCSTIDRRRWVRITGQPMLRNGRIFGVVGTMQNIDERKAVEAKLRHQAYFDSLTNLPNRNTILARIEDAIHGAVDACGPALLYIDLDRFKVLNDLLGHSAGDQLLVAAAEKLRDCAHGVAELARFENDQFVGLLAKPQHPSEAATLAQRIIDAFAKPFELGGEKFALTCSIGVAHYPDDGTQVEQLLRHADAAMFEAKHRGRSTWRQYSDLRPSGVDEGEQLQVQTLLRLALDKHEFELLYQPQVDLVDGHVDGAEALLRWNNPQLGVVLPARFIAAAESSGDIVRIGAWAIDEACRQLRGWRDQNIDIPRVAVNVSYRQFISGTLSTSVAASLKRHNLPGDALELELTERVMVENLADTAQTFHDLRALGVTLTIDDFGEGYSSLNYLRHLPVDRLKISHTFMQGVPLQPTDNAICEAIVRIAHSLHLKFVAEGVETEAQRQFLLALHTPSAQGYLFAKPMPAADVAAFVEHADSRVR